ncbi:MAG: thioredoxin fold domain-containing protein [Proteobacteria bacterium]|nr:DUF255 domain-containing protein [Desulfobacula sp.]MBU4130693.1 thioredoxin fold domain-containing protein [Pseudomonadota bacterium]
MKKENVLVIALIGLVVAGIFFYNRSKAPEPVIAAAVLQESDPLEIKDSGIAWKDYTPGMAIAGKGNKPVFLYFHAPWCTYCTKLKQTTFKDKQVLAYLEKNFISIQVDTDQNQELGREWKVKGLPTMWFLEPDGKKINSIPGYLDAPQLLLILKYIQTKSYTKMEFQEFMKQG